MARRGSGEEWTTLVVTEPRAPIFPVTSCWQLDQTASTTPWLFPGQEPARPLGATYLSLKLRQHGIDPLQAETVLASPWPPTCSTSVLARFHRDQHQQRHPLDRLRQT